MKNNKEVTAHTPTPWRLGHYQNGGRTLVRDDGKKVENILTIDSSVKEHNAEFIVRAVNSHAALLEAAKRAFRELNEIRARDGVPRTFDGLKSSVDPEYFSSVVDGLQAAIAQAKAVKP